MGDVIANVAVAGPQVRIQNRTIEQIVDVPVPILGEAIASVALAVPQVRILNRTIVSRLATFPSPWWRRSSRLRTL